MHNKLIISICSSNSTNYPARGALDQIMMLLHSNPSTLWVKAWVTPLIPSLQIQTPVLSSSYKWEHKSSLSPCWSCKIEGHMIWNVHFCNQLNEQVEQKGKITHSLSLQKLNNASLYLLKPPFSIQIIEITRVNRPSVILCHTHTLLNLMFSVVLVSCIK